MRFRGTVYALVSCFIWGWIFIIPPMIKNFSVLEIATGRFFFFGVLSLFLFLKKKSPIRSYTAAQWKKVAGLSLLSSFGYYTFVVLALDLSSPAICALILGISPLTIAFYGNWRQKEGNFKKLLLPSLLILMGLVVVNAPHFRDPSSSTHYFFGLLASFCALIGWSWFAVANACFLKEQSDSSGDFSSQWSTLLGVGTLFWTLLSLIVGALLWPSQFHWHQYLSLNSDLLTFFMGCGILGVVCSWVGGFLWNRASLYLPVSTAGQLTIFETIFGLLFFYLVSGSWPSPYELVGITLFLIAIVHYMRTANKSSVARTEL